MTFAGRTVALILLLACTAACVPAEDQYIFPENSTSPYRQYELRLLGMEKLLEGGEPDPERLALLQELASELEATPFDDLEARSRLLLFLLQAEAGQTGLTQQALPDLIQKQINRETRANRIRTARSISLATAVASLMLFNLFWYVSDAAYDSYRRADTVEEMEALKQRMKLFDTLSAVSGSISLVSLGVSIPLMAAGPEPRRGGK